MKNSSFTFVLMILLILTSACSTIKVLDAWKSEDIESVKPQNILVIARTTHQPSRVAFEQGMVKELIKNGLKGTASYKIFSELEPNKKLSQEEIESIKEKFRLEGFDAVILSIVKDVKEISETTIDGGYEAGASLSSYYDMSYLGFYGYYASPGSYASYEGVDVAETMTTRTNKIYVLETSVHNLELPLKKQLVAVVTSKIDQPENITALADEYAKAVAKALK
jgi:hypothetical protein